MVNGADNEMSGQVVCAECKRKMEPMEFRAFPTDLDKFNSIICPQCFKKHTGSKKYEKYMFQKTWIIDGVKYPR